MDTLLFDAIDKLIVALYIYIYLHEQIKKSDFVCFYSFSWKQIRSICFQHTVQSTAQRLDSTETGNYEAGRG